jgi:predicted metal-dependent phosphoesterase TrpH
MLQRMAHDLLTRGDGRFYRGNLHCHSNRSDGTASPEAVARAYRDAGYDFILLSDHFEAEYGWQITDTRDLRTPDFTTLLGAELSSAAWDDRLAYWVAAAGLPPGFERPPAGDHAEAITRAHDAGAFVTLLHPGLNNLPLEAVTDAPIDAVEIYNHNTAAAHPERAEGGYMADGLLERGRRLLLTAGDDAHFLFDGDRFGAWVEVHAVALDPAVLLAALKAGTYYSTQGPRIERLELDGHRLHVATSKVASIAIGGGGDRWQDATEQRGSAITEATFDLTAFRGSYCRVTAVDSGRRRAWSNPIWP